jgi:two-component system, LuxR family, sensor kinase FixL
VRLGRSDSAPTSVATIVGETVDLARADLERQSIALKLEVASDLPLIMADRLQIEQVLMNLIRNSMDAITENNVASGQIVISAKHVDSQHVELTVSDTGPGFPSGFGEEDPLPLMTTKPEGLGIGLSLCRSIVEAHAGTLSIRSSRRGASVSVLLPISESSHHG